MNPVDKNVQELTQSLHQAEETIQQLTQIISKSEKRSQLLERTFRWLAVLFICLTMTVFYVGFNWVNKAQATDEKPEQPKTTQTEAKPESSSNQEKPKPGTPKPEVQSCRQGVQLMMIKQAQELMLTGLTLGKEIQQLPPEDPMKKMYEDLMKKLEGIQPNMDNVFKDNSRIACQIFLRVDNFTRKLDKFKADWPVIRKTLLLLLFKLEKSESPLAKEISLILDYLQENQAIKKIVKKNGQVILKVLKPNVVDNAFSTYLAWGVMVGISSLDEIFQVLDDIPEMKNLMRQMNINMEDMNAHMYYMGRNMGIMSYDMDSTMGRAGRNMPWMPW